ncbi:MAG: hypothetical protein ACFFDS_09110 [Candidatus Thorarchaeota archaeon]
MVFLNYVITISFICFVLGISLMLFLKTNFRIIFGFLLIFLSGIIIISSVNFTAESFILVILGLVAFSIIFIFVFRDQLIFSLKKEGMTDD